MTAVAWSMFGIAAAGVIAIYAVVAPDYSMRTAESQHDRDLRDCRNRYEISSPYVEAEFRRWGLEMVAACMRGRGY